MLDPNWSRSTPICWSRVTKRLQSGVCWRPCFGKKRCRPCLKPPPARIHGQIRVRVGAGIAHAAPKDHGGVVQQGAAADVIHRAEPFQKVIQLCHQRGLDEMGRNRGQS